MTDNKIKRSVNSFTYSMIIDAVKNHLKDAISIISPIVATNWIYSSDVGDDLKREISEYTSPLLQAYNSLSHNQQLLLVGGSLYILGLGIGYKIKSNKENKELEKKLTKIDEKLEKISKIA